MFCSSSITNLWINIFITLLITFFNDSFINGKFNSNFPLDIFLFFSRKSENDVKIFVQDQRENENTINKLRCINTRQKTWQLPTSRHNLSSVYMVLSSHNSQLMETFTIHDASLWKFTKVFFFAQNPLGSIKFCFMFSRT